MTFFHESDLSQRSQLVQKDSGILAFVIKVYAIARTSIDVLSK